MDHLPFVHGQIVYHICAYFGLLFYDGLDKSNELFLLDRPHLEDHPHIYQSNIDLLLLPPLDQSHFVFLCLVLQKQIADNIVRLKQLQVLRLEPSFDDVRPVNHPFQRAHLKVFSPHYNVSSVKISVNKVVNHQHLKENGSTYSRHLLLKRAINV